ncbi:universal stress protein (plasmid) [Burkholderia thailandensis]|uniref:universal stress protein n=1 Tax=Burkholderia thailandensis TaxID=57975 RepID=UPI00192D487C|nr:universal stress protein [Burkholderia thailandensis]MBS2132191.1 universal stress protein [Burkholderia thailandensis]QRA15287.1 universal stress protein [Burkholderia thailandensis]
MNWIVAATDGSDGASRAVEYAARWANRETLGLLIVNVVGGYGLPEKAIRSLTHAQTAWFDEMLAALSAETLKNARDLAWSIGAQATELESRAGEVAPTLIEIAEEKKAQAIVVGKRGAGRISGLLLGSVSQALVSLAPVPVVVVP